MSETWQIPSSLQRERDYDGALGSLYRRPSAYGKNRGARGADTRGTLSSRGPRVDQTLRWKLSDLTTRSLEEGLPLDVGDRRRLGHCGTGVLREVKEEIGLDFTPEQAELVYSYGGEGVTSRAIVDVYLFEYDGEVDLSRATTNEVLQSKWMTYDEILALKEREELVWILDYFFEGNVKG